MQREHSFSLPNGYLLHEYRIERILGHGGFGVTYLAQDQHLNSLVAIKEFLPQEFAVRSGTHTVGPRSRADAESYLWGLDRFKQEARALARFKHPHIVRATRLIEANGTAYMVMDYERGMTLKEYQRRAGRTLDEAQLLGVFLPILDGLHELHSSGLIHRDIKPGNIYLRSRGGPMLIDFGAVRQAVTTHSQALTSLVTPGYAPLEQYSGESRQGPYSDLYAVGATMYACITGRSPTDAARRSAAMQEGDADPHVRAVAAGEGRYSPPLLEAVDWALALRAKDRPQDATEFAARLRESPVSPALVLPDAAAEIEVPTQIAEPPSGALLADDDATMRNSGPPPTLILSPGDGGRPGALRWPELPWRAWLERARTLFVTRPSAATLRKAALAALGVVGLVAAFAYGRERRDESLYAAAARAATAAAYRDYLARCALCAHRAEAEAALLALEGYATPTTSGASLAITPQPAPRGEPARTAAAPSQGRTAARAAPSTATSAPAPAPRIAPGTVFRDSLGEAGQGPPLVMLAGGSFTIGDPTRTIPSATPLRTVRIAPFALGEREVTRGEFRAFVDATGHETDAQQNGGCRVSRDGTQVRDRWSSWKRGPFSQSDQSPVICVSWRDAQAYVAWLAQRTGRRYRLPTEAEWEYAARAGSTGTYWWGEDGSSGRANCAGCGRGSRKRTVDADEFEPNPWGLRNTAGNVWEWTCSVFEPRYAGAEARCAASSSLGERAIRGGSWAQGAEFLRSAYRASAPPGLASDTVGFRVALDP